MIRVFMLLSSKGFGSTMIITGTNVGAGMLAIPAMVSSCGFWLASALLIIVWFVMMQTALLIAEINLDMPNNANFNYMAKITLGKSGQIITYFSYLFLLYLLTAAYTSAGGNLIASGFKQLGIFLPFALNSALFIIILGLFIYVGTHAVDHINRLFIFAKFLVFFIFVVAILPNIQLKFLNAREYSLNVILVSFPILITSFGFHHIIPSLRNYVNSDKNTLRQAIIWGSFIPLLIYLIWIFCTLGSIPPHGEDSFASIIQSGDIASGIIENYENIYISLCTYLFESIAIITSFLGVSLGLFDFNCDTYRLQKPTYINRIKAFLITFIPPFIFATFYPQGFIIALGYASIFVAILLIALPAIMAWVTRNRKNNNPFLSKFYLGIIVMVAIAMIIIEIFTILNYLP